MEIFTPFVVNVISWILVGLSLAGYFFVIRKHVIGQWLWAISNVGWIAFNLSKDIPSSAFMFAVYLAMNIWGILVWSRDNKQKLATNS